MFCVHTQACNIFELYGELINIRILNIGDPHLFFILGEYFTVIPSFSHQLMYFF